MIEEVPNPVVAHLDTAWFNSANNSRPVISGFSDSRARTQAASSANANGFLPPIGSAAALPVFSVRFVQRIAEEWLTPNRRAADAPLMPPATAATTRSQVQRVG